MEVLQACFSCGWKSILSFQESCLLDIMHLLTVHKEKM